MGLAYMYVVALLQNIRTVLLSLSDVHICVAPMHHLGIKYKRQFL